MNQDLLTREIIKKIMADIGYLPKVRSQIGLLSSDLRGEPLVVQYDEDNIAKHPVWVGEAKAETTTIRACACDLSQDVDEFILVIRSEQNSIFGLKLIFDDQDCGIFLVQEQGNWIPASTIVKAKALIGMEMLTTYGVSWNKCDRFDDIYSAMVALADM